MQSTLPAASLRAMVSSRHVRAGAMPDLRPEGMPRPLSWRWRPARRKRPSFAGRVIVYKRKHPERFDAWWRPLTRQGDPSHRYDLVGEAFDAGYEAGKSAALLTLGRKLIEQYEPTPETPVTRCSCKDFPGADEFCTATAHKAPKTPPEHVCGLQGFGAPGDICPACSTANRRV